MLTLFGEQLALKGTKQTIIYHQISYSVLILCLALGFLLAEEGIFFKTSQPIS